MRGKRLSELQPKNGFALSKFLDGGIPLADAVSVGHQEGITHRDSKPDNVMVSDDGRVKVLDFGLAKSETGFLTEGDGRRLGRVKLTSFEGRDAQDALGGY